MCFFRHHLICYLAFFVATLLYGLSQAEIDIGCVSEASGIACSFDPRPAESDFSLPMPGGMRMVFRKVIVPGKEFWGNEDRLIPIGDIEEKYKDDKFDSTFEGSQKLPVYGSFFDAEAEQWYYYLGKYEVTVAQYMAVMGQGDLSKGLEYFGKTSKDEALFKELKKAFEEDREKEKHKLLAKPLTWVSWRIVQDFIHEYNMWCYQNNDCLNQLPRLPVSLKEMAEKEKGRHEKDRRTPPGFLRLPTEIEWEYAARGGFPVLERMEDGRSVFEKSLPFPETEMKNYAWTKPSSVRDFSATRIGRFKDIYGFYDLFGNAQELTANLFAAETIQGKVGARTVRGGSYNDDEKRIRVSLRSETPLYQLDKTGKISESYSPFTGFRLTIGSLVIQSARSIKHELREEYTEYAKTTRKRTPVGLSLLDSLIIGEERIKGLIEKLEKEKDEEIKTLVKGLENAEKDIKKGIFEVSRYMTEVALHSLSNASYQYYLYRKREEFIKKLSDPISPRTKRILDKAKKAAEKFEKVSDRGFETYVKTLDKLIAFDNPEIFKEAMRLLRDKYPSDHEVKETLKLISNHVENKVPKYRRINEGKELASKIYGDVD